MEDLKSPAPAGFPDGERLTLPLSAPAPRHGGRVVNLLQPGDGRVCPTASSAAAWPKSPAAPAPEVVVESDWGRPVRETATPRAQRTRGAKSSSSFMPRPRPARSPTPPPSPAGARRGGLSVVDTVTGLGGVRSRSTPGAPTSPIPAPRNACPVRPGSRPSPSRRRAVARQRHARCRAGSSTSPSSPLLARPAAAGARVPPHRAGQRPLRPPRIVDAPAGGGSARRPGPPAAAHARSSRASRRSASRCSAAGGASADAQRRPDPRGRRRRVRPTAMLARQASRSAPAWVRSPARPGASA